jgi:hypothetical protein
VPGWEDSTLGNIFAAHCPRWHALVDRPVLPGIEYMRSIANWYRERPDTRAPGFFQIGGGIAGDFPICVVPMLRYDLKEDVPVWSYFCQISDSTTSYGSYSGAVPNEKITWGKLAKETPRFIIESDATIVAPLIFATTIRSMEPPKQRFSGLSMSTAVSSTTWHSASAAVAMRRRTSFRRCSCRPSGLGASFEEMPTPRRGCSGSPQTPASGCTGRNLGSRSTSDRWSRCCRSAIA